MRRITCKKLDLEASSGLVDELGGAGRALVWGFFDQKTE